MQNRFETFSCIELQTVDKKWYYFDWAIVSTGSKKESLENYQSKKLLICSKCTPLLVAKENISCEVRICIYLFSCHHLLT